MSFPRIDDDHEGISTVLDVKSGRYFFKLVKYDPLRKAKLLIRGDPLKQGKKLNLMYKIEKRKTKLALKNY